MNVDDTYKTPPCKRFIRFWWNGSIIYYLSVNQLGDCVANPSVTKVFYSDMVVQHYENLDYRIENHNQRQSQRQEIKYVLHRIATGYEKIIRKPEAEKSLLSPSKVDLLTLRPKSFVKKTIFCGGTRAVLCIMNSNSQMKPLVYNAIANKYFKPHIYRKTT